MIDLSLGRIMEDQFFLKKDQLLIEARKKLEAMQETKANLAQVSGIKDEAVLDKLIQLNIRPEVLATLFAFLSSRSPGQTANCRTRNVTNCSALSIRPA